MAPEKQIIGWKEQVDLPELGLYGVQAKTDTGAITSVLHCSHIKLITRKGQKLVEFLPLDGKLPGSVLPYKNERVIKNSFGQKETRYIVETAIVLFGKTHRIELSLRDRSEMEFPMLLGRSFIQDRFLIDASRSDLSLSYTSSNNKKRENSRPIHSKEPLFDQTTG